jgi:hypothetical protein
MIGLIVIAPLGLFLGWILKNSVTLYRGRAWPGGWVSLFWLSAVLGLGLGIWFCGYAEWESMQFRRLPIPISRFNPATGVWRDLEMVPALRQLVLIVDFFAGLALAIVPITVSMRFAEFMDESRRLAAEKTAQAKPSSAAAP